MFGFLFGSNKKKCDRRKKACKRAKRYNVVNSECNHLTTNVCRSNKRCTYVKGRGCRRAKGFAQMIIQCKVPEVNTQVMNQVVKAIEAAIAVNAAPEEVVAAATAAAADMASENAASVGASPEEAHIAGVNAATEVATAAATEAGVPPEQIPVVVAEAIKVIEEAPVVNVSGPIHTKLGPGKWSTVNAPVLLKFGRRNYLFGRKYRFGSECSQLSPKNVETCMRYTNSNGMYPCNWSGGANARCQNRINGPVPYSIANTSGKYMQYVIAVIPGLNEMIPPTQPTPVAPLVYGNFNPDKCAGFNENDCGSNPNCNWQVNAKKCQRASGYLSGVLHEGPSLPPTASFGKKRRKSSNKKKRVKRLSSKIRKICKRLKIKTTKRVGRHRVQKSLKSLMKQIKLKLKKLKKLKKMKRKTS